MNYIAEDKKLTIDLSKEKYDPAMLLQYEDVKEIRIDKYSDSIDLLLEKKNVDTLSIYVTDLKKTYIPPGNLDKLQNLKDLTLWSEFEIAKLAPMPNLESYSTIIRSTDRIKLIAEKFPNLKRLELWGSAQPNQKIPAEIGNFQALEFLEFVNFSFSELPEETLKLKALKSLHIRGGGAVLKFSKVICNLSWLEDLRFQQQIITLPEQFCNLKFLKKLNFDGAFNQGTMSPVDKWNPQKKIYLHPIPDVIGELPSLEELNISCCGVVNLDFIKKSQNLKKLVIDYSGLKNLNDLSALKNLEELSLPNADVLKDIMGIAGLPIKKLDLEMCDGIKSIEVIKNLPLLEELNIKGCDEIENFDLLYHHPTLKILDADDTILEQWKLKDLYINLPPLKFVLKNIQSGNIELFEKAISDLKLHVDKNSTNDFNPLASYFGEEPDNSTMVHLGILENAFMQHRSKLSIDTLLTLVDISLHSVIEDNYFISVLAIEEICNHKDAIAQIKVIELFRKACEYYDFGHRMQDDTVLDKLYDDLFPAFETEALITLLKKAPADMMNCEGGDCADRCFIPAFEKVTNEEQFNEMITIFFGYKKSYIQYIGNEYFTELQNEIIKVLTGNHLEKFQENIEEDAESA